MKIVLAGGGTGGHLFPGIAVAEEFRKRSEAPEVIFIGTEKGIEASIIPREGYPIRYVGAEGVVGKSFAKKFSAVVRTAVSVFEAHRLLRGLRPDAVIGLGGYASFGPVLVGRSFRSPR